MESPRHFHFSKVKEFQYIAKTLVKPTFWGTLDHHFGGHENFTALLKTSKR